MRSRVSGVFAGKVRRATFVRHTTLSIFYDYQQTRIQLGFIFVAMSIYFDELTEEDIEDIDL